MIWQSKHCRHTIPVITKKKKKINLLSHTYSKKKWKFWFHYFPLYYIYWNIDNANLVIILPYEIPFIASSFWHFNRTFQISFWLYFIFIYIIYTPGSGVQLFYSYYKTQMQKLQNPKNCSIICCRVIFRDFRNIYVFRICCMLTTLFCRSISSILSSFLWILLFSFLYCGIVWRNIFWVENCFVLYILCWNASVNFV